MALTRSEITELVNFHSREGLADKVEIYDGVRDF